MVMQQPFEQASFANGGAHLKKEEMMDTFQIPPPLLPDLVSSPPTFAPSEFNNSTHTADCPTSFPSSSITSPWPIATPCSSSSSTTVSEYAPHPPPPPPPLPPATCHRPPPPSPPYQAGAVQIAQPSQMPEFVPGKEVEQLEEITRDLSDDVVLTNSICLLFGLSIDPVCGRDVCQQMAANSTFMSRLYYVLTDESYQDLDLLICYATGSLTNISKYEEGRTALLGCDEPYSYQNPSKGVASLLRSLQSRDSNVVIFAITAIHALLIDRRVELAKEQIKYGLKYIVQLLDNQSLMNNYQFKAIVLDCLQILAYGNRENRMAFKESGGPFLLLRTIEENLDNQHAEELIETASRVLKIVSSCPENKRDIIAHGGIELLSMCIKKDSHEILKNCLWTLRNLSDVINNSSKHGHWCVDNLVGRLLQILRHDVEPCIITCALGILANLTCNNETIKKFICEENGIRLLLNTIDFAYNLDPREFYIIDIEHIVEPAVCTLCHLLNQNQHPELVMEAKRIIRQSSFHAYLSREPISDDLKKAVDKLTRLMSPKLESLDSC